MNLKSKFASKTHSEPKAVNLLMSELPELMKPKDAAAFLTISVARLALMRAEGNGPKYSRLSPRRLVYRLEDLRAFVAENLGVGA